MKLGLSFSNARSSRKAAASRWRDVAFVAGLLLIVSASVTPALAYIDPNSGGLLFQILAPVFAVGAVGMAFLRRKIRNLFAWSASLFRR